MSPNYVLLYKKYYEISGFQILRVDCMSILHSSKVWMRMGVGAGKRRGGGRRQSIDTVYCPVKFLSIFWKILRFMRLYSAMLHKHHVI